jgi:hypothetical protein
MSKRIHKDFIEILLINIIPAKYQANMNTKVIIKHIIIIMNQNRDILKPLA